MGISMTAARHCEGYDASGDGHCRITKLTGLCYRKYQRIGRVLSGEVRTVLAVRVQLGHLLVFPLRVGLLQIRRSRLFPPLPPSDRD